MCGMVVSGKLSMGPIVCSEPEDRERGFLVLQPSQTSKQLEVVVNSHVRNEFTPEPPVQANDVLDENLFPNFYTVEKAREDKILLNLCARFGEN